MHLRGKWTEHIQARRAFITVGTGLLVLTGQMGEPVTGTQLQAKDLETGTQLQPSEIRQPKDLETGTQLQRGHRG